MRTVVTGAAGNIGRTVSYGLRERGHDVVALDQVRADGMERVDVSDILAMAPLVEGADAVVHLAGYADEGSLQTALHTHVHTTHAVLEAMRRTGVPRIVYASSAHAVGFTPSGRELSVHTRPRPDTFYGVGKVAAEALCSLYVDRYGLTAACLRIGAFVDRPHSRQHLAIWLSPGDAVRLVEACLTAPELTFAVVHGISANTRRWWDLEPGRVLGYHPEDDAEVYAADIEVEPESEQDRFEARYVGGRFCAPYGYT
ncbi:MAG TPA: NAD(P)-dependent oxidoreductase [Jiangellaceae bacterium]|nr:NAD(P)-dependent oxidoreductase [Jiangellaceae bacterium]